MLVIVKSPAPWRGWVVRSRLQPLPRKAGGLGIVWYGAVLSGEEREEKAKKMTKEFDGKAGGGSISSRQPKTLARAKEKRG